MIYVHASEGRVYGAGDVRIFNYALTAAQVNPIRYERSELSNGVKDVMNQGAVFFGPSTGAP